MPKRYLHNPPTSPKLASITVPGTDKRIDAVKLDNFIPDGKLIRALYLESPFAA